MVKMCIKVRHIRKESSIYVHITTNSHFLKLHWDATVITKWIAHTSVSGKLLYCSRRTVEFWLSPVRTLWWVCGKADVHDFGRALRWQKRWCPHGTSAKRASRGATKHTSQESTASADTVDVVPAALLVLVAGCGCVRSSSSSVSSSSSESDWLSLIILSEPTAWLIARRNWRRVYLALSNLSMHILMRLSFVRFARFLARLMGKPLLILLTSDWL